MGHRAHMIAARNTRYRTVRRHLDYPALSTSLPTSPAEMTNKILDCSCKVAREPTDFLQSLPLCRWSERPLALRAKTAPNSENARSVSSCLR
jgi:hypothetical protein